MVSAESPAVARRRVRLALRGAREAMGYTQAQVAAALEWSLSKVNRIESGEVSVSATDLRALLDHYGITDDATVGPLLEAARTSRRQRWYTDPRFREHLTPATTQLLQFESEASAIRLFNLTMIPGLLQTNDYAETILKSYREDLSKDDLTVRFEVRTRRREIISRPDPPDLFIILDESVLYRTLGAPNVMADQLQWVLDLMKRPNIMVRVLPFTAATPVVLHGSFTLLDLGEGDDAILYREAHLIDEIVDTPDKVRSYRDVFEQVWKLSLGEAASARLLEARAAAMLSSLDYPK